MNTIYDPGTLMIADMYFQGEKSRTLVMVVSYPHEGSKLNIHRVYRFDMGTIVPFLQLGNEEVL